MKRLVLILVAALFVVSFLFGQQPTLTRLATVAGDSTIKLISRGAMDYLSNGVIWVAATDFVGTGKQYMYLSTDNGVNWTKSTVFNNPGYTAVGITGVAAKDANICNVITATGEIFRTTNGGVKWDTASATYSEIYAFGDGIRFVSGDTMMAYGDNDEKGLFVARSFDAGKTWTRVPNVNSSLPGDSLNMDELYESQASYAQGSEVFGRNIWLTLDNTTGDPGSILKSTDAGATWSWFRIALPGGVSVDNRLQSITFKDANNGFGVCRQVGGTAEAFRNYLVRTSDGGRTWSDTISIEPTQGHINAKPMTVRAIRGTNTVIAVGFGGPAATSTSKAWISNDNGTTWASLNAPSPVPGSDLRNVVFGPNNKAIVVGYQNWVTFAVPTAVETEHNTVPTGFALEQNYPNPFNPTTKISYTVPKTSFVELKVYDLLGRTVATLVSSEQSAGSHSVVFDAKGLSSGSYLYTMKSGEFTATKSLVLVK
jgi:photosystem II stability/assembly factor-like uncharacterized protein